MFKKLLKHLAETVQEVCSVWATPSKTIIWQKLEEHSVSPCTFDPYPYSWPVNSLAHGLVH